MSTQQTCKSHNKEDSTTKLEMKLKQKHSNKDTKSAFGQWMLHHNSTTIIDPTQSWSLDQQQAGIQADSTEET